MPDYLFTEASRDNARLEDLLIERSRTARDSAFSVSLAEFQKTTDEEILGRLLVDWTRFAQPVSRASDPTLLHGEPLPTDRRAESGERPRYWGWAYLFKLAGNTELLKHWPKEFRGEPSGSNRDFEPMPRHLWLPGPGEVAVLLEVPRDTDPNGQEAPADRVLEAARYLNDVITCVNQELETYQTQLVGQLRTELRERRQPSAQSMPAIGTLSYWRPPKCRY
jgi:hypothetical protein